MAEYRGRKVTLNKIMRSDRPAKKSMVYVKNLVQALYLASEKSDVDGQVFHITDGKDITRKEFITILANKLGYAPPEAHVPAAIAKLACPVLEFINKISGSKEPPLLNKFRMKFMDTYLTFDISKAEKQLGYTHPYSYTKGLEETVEWFTRDDKVAAGVAG